MPFTVLVLTAAVLLGYLRGGRLYRVADADLRGSWLLFAGLALQVVGGLPSLRGFLVGGFGTLLLLASQGLVAAWVFLNRYRPGMPLILLGLLLNAAVIAANGAMPVSPRAIQAIGLPPVAPGPGKHMLMTQTTRLRLLADIVPLPMLRTIVSIGDLVLSAGLIPLLHHLMSYETVVERRGGLRGATPLTRPGLAEAAPAAPSATSGDGTPPKAWDTPQVEWEAAGVGHRGSRRRSRRRSGESSPPRLRPRPKLTPSRLPRAASSTPADSAMGMGSDGRGRSGHLPRRVDGYSQDPTVSLGELFLELDMPQARRIVQPID